MSETSDNKGNASGGATGAPKIELVLWRHAEAEEAIPGKLADEDRALTPRGQRQAARMGAWLNARLSRQCRILVSPARRTRQTALALDHAWDADDRVGLNAGPQNLLMAVEWPRRAGVTVVVGHQPTLGQVAARLLPSLDLDWNMERGAIVWLMHRPDIGKAVLRVAMTPEAIKGP